MRRCFLGLALAVLATGPVAADEKADAIVKKAIEAHGGADALNKYKAGRFNMKGNISVAGMDLDFTGKLAYSSPDRYHLEISSEIMGQKLVVNQVVKGDKVKSTVTVGGMTIPTPKEDDDELKLAAILQEAGQLTPLLDKKKFTLKAEPDEDVDGKKASVVIVTPASLKREIKFFIDQKSGLLVKTSHRGKGPGDDGATKEVLEETFSSDYKKVNGVQVATKLVVKHDDKKFMSVDVSDIELVEKIDDKEFTVDD